MNLTSQGYYNLITDVADAEDMYKLFEPAEPGEKFGRLEDVETAIRYIGDSMDSDNFANPTDDEWLNEELLMKGYMLEHIRFNILREDWEPIFQPFPHNPVQYYDPDVTVREASTGKNNMRMWVVLRQVPSEYQESYETTTVRVRTHHHKDEHKYNYSIEEFGIEAMGMELADTINNFLDKADADFDHDTVEELEEKLGNLYEKARLTFDRVE